MLDTNSTTYISNVFSIKRLALRRRVLLLPVQSFHELIQQDEENYTTFAGAGKLRFTPKTVRERIQRSELKAIDAGQGYRIFKSDYKEFLESRRRRNERK